LSHNFHNTFFRTTYVSVLFCVGIYADLFYVRNGIINNNALSFVVPIKTDINTIYFDWQSLRRSPPEPQVSYSEPLVTL